MNGRPLCSRAGELVAFPTDTVYGLGAIFDDATAVERLYVAKGRPETKGIPILLAGADELPMVVRDVPEGCQPPVGSSLARSANARPAQGGQGARDGQPNRHRRRAGAGPPLARALVAAAGAPLATTSANRSGELAPTDPALVLEMLSGQFAALLDGGTAPGGTPSTIVDCTVSPPQVLRVGPVSAAAVSRACRATLFDHPP